MGAGLLLCLEGLDGCGKSTHAKLLANWLRSIGKEVLVTDEPTDGAIGKIIKRMLKGGPRLPATVEALLFAADRLQHIVNVIEPSLKAGKVVITERYVHSSLAYQSARGAPMRWVESINRRVTKPDLAFLIDVPAETALVRMKPTRTLDEFERDIELQRRVRRNYLRMAKCGGLVVIDGARPVNDVQAELRRAVGALLDRRQGR